MPTNCTSQTSTERWGWRGIVEKDEFDIDEPAEQEQNTEAPEADWGLGAAIRLNRQHSIRGYHPADYQFLICGDFTAG